MKNLLYLLAAIVLGTAIYFISTAEETTTLSSIALTDFVVQDTAAIGRIFIADRHGNVADLKRQEDDRWKLNDQYYAKQYAVHTLMRTFKLASIQQPVTKKSRETVMKIIAGDNRKVKLYDRDGNWIKTWYVARATRNNQGTYALLETPEDGLSNEPVVLDMKGFRGYLTSRFHTNVDEWRSTEVFIYPDYDITEIRVERPKMIGKGFRIAVDDVLNGQMGLFDDLGRQLPADLDKLRRYAMNYSKVHLEHFEPLMTDAEKDSLVNVPPDYRISVTDGKGVTQSVDLYYKKMLPEVRDRLNAGPDEYDPDRYNLRINGEWASAQDFVFGKLIVDSSELMREAGPFK